MRSTKTDPISGAKAAIEGSSEFVASAKPVLEATFKRIAERQERSRREGEGRHLRAITCGPAVPMKAIKVSCRVCYGAGVINRFTCQSCIGRGYVVKEVRDI